MPPVSSSIARMGALGVLAPVVACGPADVTPPVLEHAEFRDRSTLILQFSEPIGSVADVDPAEHFRLGVALVIADDDGNDLSVYYDLAHHFPDGLPTDAGDAVGPWFRHGFSYVTAVEPGDQPDQLILRLSYPVEHYTCDALAEADALGIPAGLHVHYAQADSPRVADEAGNPLPDIGAWWVGESFATGIAGVFPELDPRLPIACPTE